MARWAKTTLCSPEEVITRWPLAAGRASEYRWVAKKQKAMAGAAMGTNQEANNATFTNPIAVADFVRALIK